MFFKATRTALIAGSICAAILGQPSESKAIFHWFSRCCGGGGGGLFGNSTNYAPNYSYYPQAAYPQAACSPCAQQVNYVPQTSYRTEYACVPVTSYRPFTASDPCTGCPVTVMRPSVAYVRQARLVPYTSYRLAYSNPWPMGYSSGQGNYYGTTTSNACCDSGSSYSTSNGASVSEGAIGDDASIAPSLADPSAAPGPTTYNESSPSDEIRERPIEPAPDASLNNGTRTDPASPQLIDPESRTTARPVGASGKHRIITWPHRRPAPARIVTLERPRSQVARPAASRAAPRTAVVDDSGWYGSSR